jgi:hypothetical protein
MAISTVTPRPQSARPTTACARGRRSQISRSLEAAGQAGAAAWAAPPARLGEKWGR